METQISTLQNHHQLVTIEKGELISYKVSGIEYIHQKGNKGWRKSDDEMFPIIGPLAKNNYVVNTKKGSAILDQHGILRELSYQLISVSENRAVYKKDYNANAEVSNSKFPEKSPKEFVKWPFDFTFYKTFELHQHQLEITFTIDADANMPFMLGYHPAFLLSDTGKEILVANGKEITLTDVYKAGTNAHPVLKTNEIILKNTNKNDVKLTTQGFDNFMLWTEVDNMLCIEPITHYTSYSDQNYTEENMFLVGNNPQFKVVIEVLS